MKTQRTPWYFSLYAQVLMGVALGIILGLAVPDFAKSLKPLGDGFIKFVKMVIAPIIFCTIVHGIASMADLKKLGRLGIKTLVYFEVVSTFALILGLLAVNLLQPGKDFNIDPAKLDPRIGEAYATQAHSHGLVEFLLNIIPQSFFGAFATGDLLQVLLVSILTAFAISALGPAGAPILKAVEAGSAIFFGIIRIIVRLAPIGAMGAMAYTVGSYGLGSLARLLEVIACFYLAAVVFVIVVLGSIARLCGFSIFRFIAYIKEELLLVLGTSSSETGLPGLMTKLQRLGCSKTTVGLVVPTGYSFNLDGTNIYLSVGAVFLAQATNTPLSLSEQLGILLIAMLSSKGASGVTGAGFVVLAATLAITPKVPIASLALLVGIDRFMSECRSLTNIIGNGVATIVISRWERELDAGTLRANLRNNRPFLATEPPQPPAPSSEE